MKIIINLLFIILLIPTFLNGFQLEDIGSETKEVESIRFRIKIFHDRLNYRIKKVESILNERKSKEEEKIESVYQDKVDEIRLKEREKRKYLISILEDFIISNKGSKEIASPMLMLADLYYDENNDNFLDKMDNYTKQLEAFSENKIKKEPEYPTLTYNNAIELYEEFSQEFPENKRLAEALYMEGYCYQEMNEGKKAFEYFNKLVNTSPNSKLVPEAYFRIGEYLFDDAQLEESIKVYKKVIDYKDSLLYDKALYKLGWSYYRLSLYDEAVSYFIKVIDFSEESTNSVHSSMRSEAIKYIAISFSDWTGLSGLTEYLKKIGGRNYEYVLYKALGNVYVDITNKDDAIKTYNYMVELFPLNSEDPEILKKVMDLQIKNHELEQSFDTRMKIVQLFNPFSDWYSKQEDDEIKNKTKKMVENLLYEYAKYFHAGAQKSKKKKIKKENYIKAAEGYKLYLKLFPGSIKETEITSLLADIYYELKMYNEAGELYKRITQLVADPNKKEFTEAAYNMVLSYTKWMKNYENSAEGKDFLKNLKKQEKLNTKVNTVKATTSPTESYSINITYGRVPVQVRKLIEINRFYIELFPVGKKTIKVIYKTGEILMKYHAYESAINEFETIIYKYPTSKLLLDSVKNIVACFTIMNKYGELYNWAEAILKLPAGKNEKVKSILKKILAGAIFKDAKKYEVDDNKPMALKTYLEILKKYPDAKFADKAVYNVGILYDKIGKYEKAIEMLSSLPDKYPKSKLAPGALLFSAEISEKVYDFLNAVNLYLKFVEKYPRNKKAADSLYNAAVWVEKWGEYRRSAELYMKYYNNYRKRKDRALILFFAADDYYKIEDWNNSIRLFSKYLKFREKDKKFRMDALYKLSLCYKNLNKMKEYYKTLKVIKKVSVEYSKKGKQVDPYYIAMADFEFAEFLFKKYNNIELKLPSRKMKKLLKLKAEYLKKVVKRYFGIISYGDPSWSAAALYKIAVAYRRFADALYNAPIPSKLTEEEVDIYRSTLEEQAFPLEDKATEYFTKVIQLAAKFKVENEWTEKARNYLAQFNEEYAKKRGNEIFLFSENDLFLVFPRTDEKNDWVRIVKGKVYYKNELRLEYSNKFKKKAFYLEQKKILDNTWRENLVIDLIDQSIPLKALVPESK